MSIPAGNPLRSWSFSGPNQIDGACWTLVMSLSGTAHAAAVDAHIATFGSLAREFRVLGYQCSVLAAGGRRGPS